MADLTKVTDKAEYDLTLAETDTPCAIKIGGNDKATDGKFVPNINASKWDDEAWLNINHPDLITSQKEALIDGKLELTVGDKTHRYYITEDGELEYEIEFATKPPSNIIELSLDFPDGLEFWYQDTLENDYNRNSGGHKTLADYLAHHIRPERVVGSYDAMWHKRNNQYKTGIFCHIYRPKAIDADGKSVWCTLSITNKVLIITIPQLWLNAAKYPVVLDPVLGYDTLGGAAAGYSNRVRYRGGDTMGATNGTIDNFNIGVWANASPNDNIKVGIYPSDGGDPAGTTLLEQVEYTAPETGWQQIEGSGSTLIASAVYHLCHIEEHADTTIRYNTESSAHYSNAATTYGEEMEAICANTGSGIENWSIYINYTEVGGGNAPTGHLAGSLFGPLAGPIFCLLTIIISLFKRLIQ